MALAAVDTAKHPRPLAWKLLAPPNARVPAGFEPNHGVRMSVSKGGVGRAKLRFCIGDEAGAALGVKAGEKLVILVALDAAGPVIWLRKAARPDRSHKLRAHASMRSLDVAFIARLALPIVRSADQPWRAGAAGAGIYIEPTGAIAEAVARIAALSDGGQ